MGDTTEKEPGIIQCHAIIIAVYQLDHYSMENL